MFAIPLVSLVALWAFAASITVSSAISDHNFNSSLAGIEVGSGRLSSELPIERAETYLWLASGQRSSKAALVATRKLVDESIPPAEAALASEPGELSVVSKAKLKALFSDLTDLAGMRQAIDAGTMSPTAAFQAYNNIIDTLFQYYTSAINDKGASFGDTLIGAADASYSLELASREAALVGGALVDRGQMGSAARQLFASSVANRRLLITQALGLLTLGLRAGYVTIVNSPPYQRFQSIEGQITGSTSSEPILLNAGAWQAASGFVLTAMDSNGVVLGQQLAANSASESDRLVTEAVLAGGLGLVAVIVSVFLLLWFGRKVTGDLTRLHGSVRAMAEERLPRVVEQLSRGGDVDVLAESPPPSTSGIDEISQIATSFATVQGAAVAATVEQARLRKGVNQVFLNISMRNQSLLHRQLGMLDGMERRTSEPGALADLFRLDHLTTRMRRHAEGLIILSGSTPGRGWREPIPVVDVLRAAIAEVEDYVRVDVVSESLDMVAGNAVNDVIHLVAELVENATVFSPPNTRIEVRADRVGRGLVAEIEDRGLGLSKDELTDINRRLARPPEFDLANSEQLGLFVVSMLAARHSIKVSLRQSAYGGTTAIVVLPFGVIVREEEAGSPDWPADGQLDDPLDGPRMLVAGTGGLESLAHPSEADDLSPFGVTGRHRLRAAATGRRADSAENPRSPDQERPPPPRTVPRAPWEYDQSEPRPGSVLLPTPPWDAAAAAAWPQAFQRVSARPEAPRTPENGRRNDQRPAPAAGAARETAAPSGSHLGMPIRVPQASLAPQLQSQRNTGSQMAVREVSDVDERSPEATRNMMVKMQQGWQRGRIDELDDPDDAPANGTDR